MRMPTSSRFGTKSKSAAQTEEQLERQLCASLKAGSRAHHARPDGSDAAVPGGWLNGLQAAKPAAQAVSQALAPE